MALEQSVADLFKDQFKKDVKISQISAEMKGKSLVIYGGNNVGKSTVASQLTNPIFMPFEKGMNAIAGSLVLKNNNWVDVRKNVRKLSGKKFTSLLASGTEMTVIWDGFERAGFYAQKYIEEKYDAFDVADARGGYGAWSQYEKEFWSQVDALLSLGYTVVFIGHAEVNASKGDKLYPHGDKRCVKPIVDNADIVAYVESNGVDEDGDEILSSAYLCETDEYFARCRFPYVSNFIEEFTAENLINTIVSGIEEQIEKEGLEAVTFSEQQEIYKGDDLNYDDLMDSVKKLYNKCKKLDILNDYADIVESHLGEDMSVSDATKKQLQPLAAIRDDVEALIESQTEE